MIVIKDNIKISDLRTFLKMILYIKSVEHGIKLSDSHINLIIDFYEQGVNSDTYKQHIAKSESEKNYFKSVATIDNAKTFLKKGDILIKNDQGELVVSPDFLPPTDDINIFLNVNIVYNGK